jgi:glycosyltransferase involved in cell wall biosynthesis
MRICYVLLSPTFGMHQYTADIANKMAQAGHEVHLVTTTAYPADRYLPAIRVHTPADSTDTGMSLKSLNMPVLWRVRRAIGEIAPDLLHFTGPHLWNTFLMQAAHAAHAPVVHTLHDLDPHSGARYGGLLRLWNAQVLRLADHILVHGANSRDRLLAAGIGRSRVTYTPLLHLFLDAEQSARAVELSQSVTYGSWALFFGRLERYKGIHCLLEAANMLCSGPDGSPRVVIAGAGDPGRVWARPLPKCVEIRNRLIQDAEAIDLFRHCGLLVLPYLDATQSALVAAAYYFRKPVLVTRVGSLPEYVEVGCTGYVIDPGQAAALANGLNQMLGDPIRLSTMGAAGRAWYDAHRVTETRALFEMYHRIAS